MRSVVPPVDGVEPELPGVVVVPPVDGFDAELPEVEEEPLEDGVETTGEVTTAVFTGVVARVTNVADFLTTAGVGFEEFPEPPETPPAFEFPDELAVHCAAQVIAADPIVTDAPTPTVAPLLQLHPANV